MFARRKAFPASPPHILDEDIPEQREGRIYQCFIVGIVYDV